MKRSNWQMLMGQLDYIHQTEEEMIDALDAGDNALHDDLCTELEGRTDALIRILQEVLEDEKDSLTEQ